jgi:hypothetical protein
MATLKKGNRFIYKRYNIICEPYARTSDTADDISYA